MCLILIFNNRERKERKNHILNDRVGKSGKDVSLEIPKSPTRRETCHKMLANHKMSFMKKCFACFFYFTEEKSKKIFNCRAVEPL